MLRQDGVKYEHEVSKADLHIEERDGTLKIYVPQDEATWDSCFLDALPLRLAAWLMAPTKAPDAVVAVVMSILTCSEAGIPSLLKKKGVPEIPEVEVPVPALSEQGDSDDLTHGLPDAVDTSAVTSAAAALRHRNGSRSANVHQIGLGHPINGGDTGLEAPVQVHLSEKQLAADRENYRQLLDSVISMAANVAQREYNLDLAGAFDSLSLNESTKFMSSAALRQYLSATPDRDYKVGAAGELFVSPPFSASSAATPTLSTSR